MEVVRGAVEAEAPLELRGARRIRRERVEGAQEHAVERAR
jgi:hypothetical protein